MVFLSKYLSLHQPSLKLIFLCELVSEQRIDCGSAKDIQRTIILHDATFLVL